MFKDTNQILSEAMYEEVTPSANRIFQILKNYKKIGLHLIVHHITQVILLLVCMIVICSLFGITDHVTGVGLLISEMVISIISLLLYMVYLVFIVLAVRSHPVLTADKKGKILFAKVANTLHIIYVILLSFNTFQSIFLALSYNPGSPLHGHSIGGTITIFFVF
ncbi:hypothetical protein EIN_230530, partial [Entamoeba invadens IP1]